MPSVIAMICTACITNHDSRITLA